MKAMEENVQQIFLQSVVVSRLVFCAKVQIANNDKENSI